MVKKESNCTDTPGRKKTGFNCVRRWMLPTKDARARVTEGGGIRARKTRKELLRVEIKEDLLDQLARNGTTGKYYIDLVDKYMDFWDLENELIADIKKRGAIVEYNNGGGQKGQKKNDSIDQRIKVNAQMLKILDSLGIKPVGDDSGDDEDEL